MFLNVVNDVRWIFSGRKTKRVALIWLEINSMRVVPNTCNVTISYELNWLFLKKHKVPLVNQFYYRVTSYDASLLQLPLQTEEQDILKVSILLFFLAQHYVTQRFLRNFIHS